MQDVDPRVEAFFANASTWRGELAALRAILRSTALTEEFKWRAPCYTFQGGNVATIWGFRENCAVSFFKGVLLKDPEGLLVAPGENSRSVRMVKFTSVAEIARIEPVLNAYIQEAIDVEKAGLKVAFPKDDLTYPEELIGKLEEDPGFQVAFDALTPGRQRGYVLYFSQPKQSKTRLARIERSATRILAGKGLHDR